jgi:hypothetical protein
LAELERQKAQQQQEEEEGPTTVFSSMRIDSPPAPAPAPQPAPVEKKEVVIIGTLSTVMVDAPAPAPAKVGGLGLKMSSLGAKKGKPKLLARKLTATGAGGGSGSGIGMDLDSFEDVDKRSAMATQEQQDHALAVQLHNTDTGNAGSSRLAAVYQDSESIYKPANAAVSKQSGSLYGNMGSASSSPRGYGGSSLPKSVPTTNGNAQQKFSSAKGISSDQYFDRDAGSEQSSVAKERLGAYANAGAISSDMLNGREGKDKPRSGSYDDFMPDELSMREIKASVRGFFDSVQNM